MRELEPSGSGRSTTRRSLGAAAVLCLAACASPVELFIELRTDYAPEIDFQSIRVRVVGDPDLPSPGVLEVPAEASSGWLDGAQVGTFQSLNPGEYWVHTELLDADGGVVGERLLLIQLARPKVATVLITRSCSEVDCPEAGDPPDAVACHGGQCVQPECTPESADTCPAPECVNDADCDPGALCGVGSCAADLCWFRAGPSACAAGQTCRPEIGCAVCDALGCEPAPTEDPELCNGIDDDGDTVIDEGFDLMSDAMHCGACDRPCSTVNSEPTCVAGACALTCDAGFGDCNVDPADGCEADLMTTLASCGACGTECRPPDRECCAGACARSCM